MGVNGSAVCECVAAVQKGGMGREKCLAQPANTGQIAGTPVRLSGCAGTNTGHIVGFRGPEDELYTALGGDGRSKFATILNLIKALDVELSVSARVLEALVRVE